MVAGRGVCMVAGGGAWDMMTYGDTINEWAARILLECILVSFNIRPVWNVIPLVDKVLQTYKLERHLRFFILN